MQNLGIESGSIEGAIVGGIVSQAGERACIINCYNKANITGSQRAAGIVDNGCARVMYCWNFGSISCETDMAGGIVSVGAKEIRGCNAVDTQICPVTIGCVMADNCVIDRDSVADELIDAANGALLQYNTEQWSALERFSFRGKDDLRYIGLKDGGVGFAAAGQEPESVRDRRMKMCLLNNMALLLGLVFAGVYLAVGIKYAGRAKAPNRMSRTEAAVKPNGQRVSVIMLAALSYGIGSVWLNPLMTLRDAEPVKSVLDGLGVPENHAVWATVALGYPLSDDQQMLKKKENVVSWVEV